MPDRILTIYEDDTIVERIIDSAGIDIIDDSVSVIEIISEGPRGPIGPQGPAGYSGAGEPFYVITSGSLYATTASISILSSISSSLIPWTGSIGTSFDLGSISSPWKSLYVSESIFIVKSGIVLAEIVGSPNAVSVGESKITTASFGFDTEILRRQATNQQTLLVQSASVSASFDDSGQFLIPAFDAIPPLKYGSIFVSGSDLYIGM